MADHPLAICRRLADAEQASALWQTTIEDTLAGKRDRALLAILLACGLRRHKAVSLGMRHIQYREDHRAIIDLGYLNRPDAQHALPGQCRLADDLQFRFVAGLELRDPCFEHASPLGGVSLSGTNILVEVRPCLSAFIDDRSRPSEALPLVMAFFFMPPGLYQASVRVFRGFGGRLLNSGGKKIRFWRE